MAAPVTIDTAPEIALELYRTMIRIRRFEETAERHFLEGELPGFIHLSIGQEAVAAGVCAALRDDDHITSTHRGHGHAIAKGADPPEMMAELYGRAEGTCKGRGGSMHIADFSVGMLGANGVVAGGLGIAVGAGLSAKLSGSDRVAVSFFGDGATVRGPFLEALNLASVWTLPVVFVCEHNAWASTARADEVVAADHPSELAPLYRMAGASVDGNDVFAVHECAHEAVARARSGGGPTIIEARTYRLRGHFVGDPMSYRPPDEVAAWEKLDPLARAAERLGEAGLLDDADRRRIDDEATDEMKAAVDFGRNGREPDPAAVREFVYAA